MARKFSLNKIKEKVAEDYRSDPNLNRAKRWIGPFFRATPPFLADYATDKLPIASWLPHYDYRWLINDLVAGITLGVMFIPQGLAYAKIATVPVANGLYASWFPSALYLFMGTSKELSVGPTSITALLTANAVSSLASEGYTAVEVSTALAFMVGVFALIVGLLKLGFLLDFVSASVLSGWISAVAIVIGLGQVGSLIGMTTPSTTAAIINTVITNLWEVKPMTLCIGFTSLAAIILLEQLGKRWGKKNKWIKFISTCRAVIVLFIFTIMSWAVNRNRSKKDYMWAVVEVDTNGLIAPKTHDSTLLSKVVPFAFAPMIAMSVEHLGVGKAFGLRNDYTIDKSQELVYLGVNNMVNSLLGAQTTGAAMSRTAVCSECNVRSPLNFAFTAGFIILTLYELAPALYWIPKATLSAIIIMAVAHLVSPPKVFYRYWRMSFIDFIASELGLWVTLFTTTEIGLAVSVGFCIVYTLLRLAFPHWSALSNLETQQHRLSLPNAHLADTEVDVPPESFLVRYSEDVLFPNAARIKSKIIDSVKIRYDSVSNLTRDEKSVDRSWNVAGRKRIEKLRRRQNIIPFNCVDTPLKHVILDFSMVGFIDVSGLFSIMELKMELRRYIGEDLQFRFFGMNEKVRERFDRANWNFAYDGEERTGESDVIYRSLESALLHRDGDDKYEIVKEKTLEV